MKEKKTKNQHSMFSNIFFFVRLLFEISPGLVIGEFIWGILMIVPSRLISVIGIKYIVDTVESGENLERIFVAVGIIALVIILSNAFTWIFREFFWNMERERVYYGLNKRLYEKAKQLDLESYDNPEFYNNFILTIESSSDNIQNLLGLVRNYVGNIISLIYKGDHYHYIVRTKNEEDIHTHDEFLWNEEDYVSVSIPKESIKLAFKNQN